MFKVKEIATGNIYTVYDVNHVTLERSNVITFLIYTEFNTWIYIGAENFEPVN